MLLGASIFGYRIGRLNWENARLKEIEDERKYVDPNREYPTWGSSSLWDTWLGQKTLVLLGDPPDGPVTGLELGKPEHATETLELTSALNGLQRLGSYEQLPQEALDMLPSLPSLEFVHANETEETQPLIDRLLTMPQVTRVAITNSAITHEQALQLGKATWLKWLVLSGKNVSPETATALRKALPDTYVYVCVTTR